MKPLLKRYVRVLEPRRVTQQARNLLMDLGHRADRHLDVVLREYIEHFKHPPTASIT